MFQWSFVAWISSQLPEQKEGLFKLYQTPLIFLSLFLFAQIDTMSSLHWFTTLQILENQARTAESWKKEWMYVGYVMLDRGQFENAEIIIGLES